MITSDKYKKTIYFILAIAISMLFGFSRFGFITYDHFFMIAHAKDMLANGLYRNTDIFTVHEGFYFLYQKWAMCFLVYLLYQIGGFQLIDFAGTVVLAVLCILIFGIMYRYNSKYPSLNLVIGSLFMFEVMPGQTLRPHVISLFVIIMEIYELERYRKGNIQTGWHLLLFLAICSLVTMWFHSTMWILCILTVLPYIFCRERENCSRKAIVLGIIIMCLMSLLQPNFLEQYHYMWVCMTIGDLNKEYI